MDDVDRYRITLQESLLTKGWEQAFDFSRLRIWVQSNRDRLRAAAKASLGEESLEHQDYFAEIVNKFLPKSNYDLPTTEAIFRPLLDSVIVSAQSIGLRPTREVELVTSTSICPTPFARPTTGTHQLFIGLGTSAFCNYWAKAFTAVVKAIAASKFPQKIVTSPENLRLHLSTDSSGLLLAARLSLYYAATGTLLGFGEVGQPPDYLSYRMELLAAMEVFALCHEYAHFLAHERNLEFVDDHKGTSHGLELFCDDVGLQIGREWGTKNNNWLAFAGVGGLAFFSAIEISETCAASLAQDGWRGSADIQGQQAAESEHPPARQRAANLIAKAIVTTCDDQRMAVSSFLAEYDLICRTIGDDVANLLKEAAALQRR